MGRKYKTKHAWKIHDVVQLRCEGYTYRDKIYMVSIDSWFNSLALRESGTNLNIGPGHVWVPSCNNSLSEPMVTEVRVTIPGPQWVNSLPMIVYYHPWINGWSYQDKLKYFNPIWVRLLGRLQLSNPSNLLCFWCCGCRTKNSPLKFKTAVKVVNYI